MEIVDILLSIIALALGGGAGYYIHLSKVKRTKDKAFEESKDILRKAERKKEDLLLEARKEVNKIQEESRKEEKELRGKIMDQEKRLISKEEQLDKKVEGLEKEREDLEKKLKNFEEDKKVVEEMKGKQMDEIAAIAKLSTKEAKELLFERIESEAKEDILEHVKKVERDVKEESDERAREILAQAIQRVASDVVSETTVTMVNLPSDDMKGRIIGKEGRNIQALERATGVDVIVDETPEVVIISGFDLVRRYIAKLALEKLVADGRIHPTRIEEMVAKAKKEVEKHIKEIGERVVYELGITGMNPDLIKLLGRLKFRTLFGQNVLKHSVEVVYIASYIAEELGANVEVVKRGALLHSIGKAMDHETEGKYSEIGAEIAKKYGMSEEVIHVIRSHDGTVAPETIEATIVAVANKIVIARPGAKKEGVDAFIKRLKNLEEMVSNFEGVESAYVVQAGKEVRVIVDPEKIDDMKAYKLSKKIAHEIEKDLEYASQIKVTLLRETHIIEYAK